LGEKGKEKRMIESTALKYITSVQVEDTMIWTESCSIMGIRREGVRKE
jgi:hypothetical protein